MKRLHIDFTLPEKEIGGSGEIAIAGDVEYSDLDSFLSESSGNFTVAFGSAGMNHSGAVFPHDSSPSVVEGTDMPDDATAAGSPARQGGMQQGHMSNPSVCPCCGREATK